MSGNGNRVVRTYTTVSEGTGEIIDQQCVYQETHSASEPPYWKCYELSAVKIPSNTPISFVHELLRRTSFANKGQIFALSPEGKSSIAEILGVGERTIERWLHELIDAHVIRRLRRSVYQVNPHVYGKGSWPTIAALRIEWDEAEKK